MSDSFQIIESCLYHLFRPIVRFCIRHSIRIQSLIEVLKKAYVDQAAEELHRRSEEISHSRINVMTGIHRAEVARIHKHNIKKPPPSHVVTRVVSRWQSDRRFCSASGKPRVLSAEGAASDFARLVTSISLDLNPYTLLFEMERTQIVQKTATGLRLCASAYISKDLKEGLEFLASDVDDLIEAVTENIDSRAAIPNLHLKTEYNNVPLEKKNEISRWFLTQGSAFHRKVERFLAKFDLDTSQRKGAKVAGPKIRVALGSFSRIEQSRPEEEEEK